MNILCYIAGMKKAYSYIRFSSPQQSKGDSYRRQNEAIKAYCTKHELELVTDAEYTFFDKGLSAYTNEHLGDKGQLARFLACVKSGEIPRGSTLIVESLDRLSRDKVVSALTQFLAINEAGIDIVTLSDRMSYKGELDTMQLVISIFVMSRAYEESSIKAQRVKSAWNEKKEKAKSKKKPISPNCPMWLSIVDDAYQEIENRADIVRRVFDLCIKGYGKGAIASTLNKECIPSFKGTTWGTSSIDKILNNRACIGEYQPHTRAGLNKRTPEGEVIKGYYPVIVDESVFYAARAASEERKITQVKRQPAKFNIWAGGVAVCGYCGANMVFVNKGDTSKGGQYLQCYETKKSKATVCPNKSVKYEKAHEVFKQILTKIDSLSLVQDSRRRLEFELNSAKGALADAENRHTTFNGIFLETKSLTAMAATDAALNDIEKYKERLEELKLEIANAEIFNKENFLALLDIESYEGRNQANRLMLRLGIKVHIASDKTTTFYNVDGVAVYKQEGDTLSEAFLNPEAHKRFLDNSTPDDLMRNKDLMAELVEGMDVEALVKAQILIEKFEEKLKNQNKT